MDALAELASLEAADGFVSRHIGPSESDIAAMLHRVGAATLDELAAKTVPAAIRTNQPLELPPPIDEAAVIAELRGLAGRNALKKSLIGMGYHGTHTPPVIQRNVLENPGWYTAYTPYQAEIAQGRLEALLNFQTMICELTAMEIANASLLDEATAAAEAMAMAHAISQTKSDVLAVATDLHPQTRAVLATRAAPIGIRLVDVAPGDPAAIEAAQPFALVLQYPGTTGAIRELSPEIGAAHEADALVIVCADPLALALLTPPGEMGADVVVGSSQRFGVPMGFGGPHAGYLATRDAYKRHMPGRLVGVSLDAAGEPAMRLALQTREQHIRREKATSNICTSQVLLAVIAGCYAVWHGPEGLRRIARRVNLQARLLADAARQGGHRLLHDAFFDTIAIETANADALMQAALAQGFNLRRISDTRIGIALDETVTRDELTRLAALLRTPLPLAGEVAPQSGAGGGLSGTAPPSIPAELLRNTPFLEQAVFHQHHAEHEMLRYLKRLEEKDIALNRSMIPLGSCTMKLNAAAEMIPITLPGFTEIHPFAPPDQTAGLRRADRASGRLAEDDHRLCRGHAAAERGFAGRVFRPAGDPRLARRAWRGASHHLPDSVQRARHQSGERGDGGIAGGGGGLRPRRQHRRGRPARQGGPACRQPGGADGDLSQHARRVRGGDPRDLRDRARARRPGLHGWRQPERAGRADQPRRDRRRCLPPQPAQDVLHSARRRRSGRRDRSASRRILHRICRTIRCARTPVRRAVSARCPRDRSAAR